MSFRWTSFEFGFVCLFMIAAMSGFRIEAVTLRVPDDFRSPKAAMAAARPGDRIEVGPGVYDEVLSVKEGIVLVGARAETIFTQEIAVRGVRDVRLARFRMRGGTDAHHFGIVIEDSEGIAVEDVFVDGFHHGISAERSDVTVEQTRIEGASDVALFIGNGSAGQLLGVDIVRNGAIGLLVSETDEVIELRESRIEENALVGIRVVNGGLRVRRTRIAQDGTGVEVQSGEVDLGRRDDLGENAFTANVLLDVSADRRVRVDASGNYWKAPDGKPGPRVSGPVSVEPVLRRDPLDTWAVSPRGLVILRWADVKTAIRLWIPPISRDPKADRARRGSVSRLHRPVR